MDTPGARTLATSVTAFGAYGPNEVAAARHLAAAEERASTKDSDASNDNIAPHAQSRMLGHLAVGSLRACVPPEYSCCLLVTGGHLSGKSTLCNELLSAEAFPSRQDFDSPPLWHTLAPVVCARIDSSEWHATVTSRMGSERALEQEVQRLQFLLDSRRHHSEQEQAELSSRLQELSWRVKHSSTAAQHRTGSELFSAQSLDGLAQQLLDASQPRSLRGSGRTRSSTASAAAPRLHPEEVEMVLLEGQFPGIRPGELLLRFPSLSQGDPFRFSRCVARVEGLLAGVQPVIIAHAAAISEALLALLLHSLADYGWEGRLMLLGSSGTGQQFLQMQNATVLVATTLVLSAWRQQASEAAAMPWAAKAIRREVEEPGSMSGPVSRNLQQSVEEDLAKANSFSLGPRSVKRALLRFISDENCCSDESLEVAVGEPLLAHWRRPGHDSIAHELVRCFLNSCTETITRLFSTDVLLPLLPDGQYLDPALLRCSLQALGSRRAAMHAELLHCVASAVAACLNGHPEDRPKRAGIIAALRVAVNELCGQLCDVVAAVAGEARRQVRSATAVWVALRQGGHVLDHALSGDSLYECCLCGEVLSVAAVSLQCGNGGRCCPADMSCAAALLAKEDALRHGIPLRSPCLTWEPDLVTGAHECGLCLFVRPVAAFVSIAACTHSFCIACACAFLHISMDERMAGRPWPLHCMASGCNAAVLLDLVKAASDVARAFPSIVPSQLLLGDAMGAFEQMDVLQLCPPNRRLYCPSFACGELLVLPCELMECRHREDAVQLCPSCATPICLSCGLSHKGSSCEDAELLQWGGIVREVVGGKNCPHCGIVVAHFREHGCHHILPATGCPACHGHFCYACLAPTWPCRTQGCAVWCSRRCDCAPCPECKAGAPCPACVPDGCASCAS